MNHTRIHRPRYNQCVIHARSVRNGRSTTTSIGRRRRVCALSEEEKEQCVVDEVTRITNEVDIWRDTPVRYLGYANECGEALRALLPPAGVPASYALAIGYVLADTLDKAVKEWELSGRCETGPSGAMRAVRLPTCTPTLSHIHTCTYVTEDCVSPECDCIVVLTARSPTSDCVCCVYIYIRIYIRAKTLSQKEERAETSRVHFVLGRSSLCVSLIYVCDWCRCVLRQRHLMRSHGSFLHRSSCLAP